MVSIHNDKKTVKGSLLSIGDIAKRTGTNVSTIRFYADQALIPVARSNSGHRVFARAVIRRVSFILIAQNLGYSLKQVRQVLDSLPDKRTPTKSDWTRLSNKFSKEIEQRIESLRTLQSKLDGCIGCGCLSLKSCRLYNPNDSAAEFGAGPRYLLGDRYSPDK
ncbi:MAG: redox-sensitive transcriptional activator SoxR [Arenicella sp.]|nr:redox-sensitive transcriptional activator SoxR [Arenicella sp.]